MPPFSVEMMPLSYSAALASLELFEKYGLKDNLIRLQNFCDRKKEQFSKIDSLNNLRVLGTIFAFDVFSKESNSYFNSLREHIYQFAIEREVLLRPLGNTI